MSREQNVINCSMELNFPRGNTKGDKMARMIKRRVGQCEIIEHIINGRRTFKCRNLKRAPSAQEIINSIKKRKIKYR